MRTPRITDREAFYHSVLYCGRFGRATKDEGPLRETKDERRTTTDLIVKDHGKWSVAARGDRYS
jgi:hypothetical protein